MTAEKTIFVLAIVWIIFGPGLMLVLMLVSRRRFFRWVGAGGMGLWLLTIFALVASA